MCTYISNISSTNHHHKEHKGHNMYVQFFLFIMDNNPRFYRQQLNRVQLYKNTISIMQDSNYTLNTNWDDSTILNIYQSAIGTRPISSSSRVCKRPGSLQPVYVCGQYIQQPVYAFWPIRVYPFHHTLRSSATCNHILFCLSLSKLINNQSQYIQALQ